MTLQRSNRIEVELRGKPGSSLSLWILGAPCGPPIAADAGPDQTVAVGTRVQLDGKALSFADCGSDQPSEDDDAKDHGKSDQHDRSARSRHDGPSRHDDDDDSEDAGNADNTPLSFEWRFLDLPAASQATLSAPTLPNPTFGLDQPGDYTLELLVYRGEAASAPDTVTISTFNSPPVAHAGTDRTVFVGDRVVLDGSASSDVDGDPLSYFWDLPGLPSGSTAALLGATMVHPEFTVDLPGTYTAELIVSDGIAYSDPARVTVTTRNSPPVADWTARPTPSPSTR